MVGMYESGINSLKLKEGGKFEYMRGVSLYIDASSEGNYTYDKKTREIILQSTYKTYNIPYTIKGIMGSKVNGCRVRLKNLDQITYSIVSKIELLINDTVKIQLRSLDTIVDVEIPFISSLSIRMYPSGTVRALNKQISTRTIPLIPSQKEISLTTDFQNKHFFYENIYDTLTVKGKKLFWPALNTRLVKK
jgi:hypothetical protein